MRTLILRALRAAVVVLAVGLLAASPVIADNENGNNQRATLFHTGPSVGDCLGNGLPNAPTGGFVNVHFNQERNQLTLNIHLRGGIPNTAYFPSIRCVVVLAPFTTDAKGNGNATYRLSATGIAPGTFSIGVGNPVTDVFFTGPITISPGAGDDGHDADD